MAYLFGLIIDLGNAPVDGVVADEDFDVVEDEYAASEEVEAKPSRVSKRVRRRDSASTAELDDPRKSCPQSVQPDFVTADCRPYFWPTAKPVRCFDAKLLYLLLKNDQKLFGGNDERTTGHLAKTTLKRCANPPAKGQEVY